MKMKRLPTTRYVIEGARKTFRYSIFHRNALMDARVEKPKFKKDGNLAKVPDVYYECKKCQELFKQKEVQVDHIEPVVPIGTEEKEMTVDEYVERAVFGKVQVLCRPCHKNKTNKENTERRKK